ncbi:serine/threonine protein kinase [Streptomyces sp. H39-C1]|uniref:serine/threonine protein kinase n=1 Tax=Streptomyces sp. H39-C1 TaxID=3004355 RepID=UPI0022AFAB22|nr:serine/threonine-protein kinase [Streptomyces sp. H39-C1]MCZ4098106.1 serine/threonine-protein kinase [Streptomyces sp. H39-C1]
MKMQLQQEWDLGEPRQPIGDEGGFGRVYEARSAAGELAAVKLVPQEPGADRELLFIDLEGVRNVVPILDSGEADDEWALVMPRADKSLRAHLDQHRSLPLDEAVRVLTDIAETLTDLDGRVVHRDLKPENVLLLDGHWCLADFGIARYAEATTAKHTFKGGGTLPYMAPECWKHQRATGATDIYALGVLAYELLEGTTPFTGPFDHDFQDQHLHGTPPPLTTAPALLAALITECLYRAPQSRPAAGNVLERLRRIPTASLSGGLAALAEANKAVATQHAEIDRQASAAVTEAERRRDLLEAAQTSLSLISEQLLTAITKVGSAAEVRRGKNDWAVILSDAQLSFSDPTKTRPDNWTQAPFDVVADASILLRIPGNRNGYDGRSHSLWYADAQVAGQYQWFETAFMRSPLIGGLSTVDPFSLSPGRDALGAVRSGMDVNQVAWPFTPLTLGDLDQFIDRWTGWLASAATGQLGHPSQMPEHDPSGSWRK